MMSSSGIAVISSAVLLPFSLLSRLLVAIMTWLRWVPSSKTQLQQAEQKVLQLPTKDAEVLDVEVGPIGDVDQCKIHTIKVAASQQDNKGTPMVLVHGFGCGGAIFAPSLDALSKRRDVYAIDMLGFGLSSRARLSTEALEAENQMVHSIESWREKMNIDKFILVGHSLGGYVSSAYALNHPNRTKHLILEDPWGYGVYDPNVRSRLPLWAKGVMRMLGHLNALSTVRAAGPYGFKMMKKALGHRHPYMGEYFPDMPDTIPTYLYHCNMRRPTGEEFFRNISEKFGWAKHPLIKRMGALNDTVGTTFIHAEHTFISRTPSKLLQEQRGEEKVKVYVIEDSGHTIHLEKPVEFNDLVNRTADLVDGLK